MPMPVPAREAGHAIQRPALWALSSGRKMRYCAPPKERLALGLRRLWAVRGLRQIALAKRAGISRGYLARLEAGQQNPTFSVVERLAKELRIPHTELVK